MIHVTQEDTKAAILEFHKKGQLLSLRLLQQFSAKRGDKTCKQIEQYTFINTMFMSRENYVRLAENVRIFCYRPLPLGLGLVASLPLGKLEGLTPG
jgi:hypothetical protein